MLFTYCVFILPFIVILTLVVLCSSRLLASSEALAMAAVCHYFCYITHSLLSQSMAGYTPTSFGLTKQELATLPIIPFTALTIVQTEQDISPLKQSPSARPHNESADTSVCAICFSDYGTFTDSYNISSPTEPGDVLRELFCSHRFHQVCVDVWLLGSEGTNELFLMMY